MSRKTISKPMLAERLRNCGVNPTDWQHTKQARKAKKRPQALGCSGLQVLARFGRGHDRRPPALSLRPSNERDKRSERRSQPGAYISVMALRKRSDWSQPLPQPHHILGQDTLILTLA
jgi:hypothetical protein